MRELFDSAKELVESLKGENGLIVVEGKKDVAKLKKFGIKSTPLKKDLKGFCESIDAKEVILLMDTDKEGKELTKKLKSYFARLGVKVNLFYWYSLKKLRVTHVEGLNKKDY
jgi:5S rRNA maturation endonuclease (ribonuclease M5)